MELDRIRSSEPARWRKVPESREGALERSADTPSNSALLALMRRGAAEQVRFHTSGRAADAAEALGAKAFTIGHDVAFASGRFAPETREGRRLIAHELTHVAQQEAEGPRLQRDGEEGEEELEPGYLRGMDARIREQIQRRLKMFKEAGEEIEIGPFETLRSKYGAMPWAENAEIEIPQPDWNAPPTLSYDIESETKAPRTYRLHQRLPGGFELVDVLNKKVLLEFRGTGLVIPDWLFAEMFEGYQELQEPVIYRHEHPGMVLAYDFLSAYIPALTAFMMANPEIGVCTMEPGFVAEGGAMMPEAGNVFAGEPGAAMEGEGLTMEGAGGVCEAEPAVTLGEASTGFGEEPTVVDVAPFGATQPAEGFAFATDEAWIYDGRVVRVIETPAGPRAFYLRTGEGGEFPFGAQPGDWVPFDGFQPQRYGAGFVKPEVAVDPAMPDLDLWRWGTAENKAINEWIKTQPEAAPVDVGENWRIMQQRLQDLGVPVAFPLL